MMDRLRKQSHEVVPGKGGVDLVVSVLFRVHWFLTVSYISSCICPSYAVTLLSLHPMAGVQSKVILLTPCHAMICYVLFSAHRQSHMNAITSQTLVDARMHVDATILISAFHAYKRHHRCSTCLLTPSPHHQQRHTSRYTA